MPYFAGPHQRPLAFHQLQTFRLPEAAPAAAEDIDYGPYTLQDEGTNLERGGGPFCEFRAFCASVVQKARL